MDVIRILPGSVCCQVSGHAVSVSVLLWVFSGSLLCREAYRGALSEEELDALDKAKMEKERAVAELLAREKELRDIRDSQLTSNKASLSAPYVQ